MDLTQSDIDEFKKTFETYNTLLYARVSISNWRPKKDYKDILELNDKLLDLAKQDVARLGQKVKARAKASEKTNATHCEACIHIEDDSTIDENQARQLDVLDKIRIMSGAGKVSEVCSLALAFAELLNLGDEYDYCIKCIDELFNDNLKAVENGAESLKVSFQYNLGKECDECRGHHSAKPETPKPSKASTKKYSCKKGCK